MKSVNIHEAKTNLSKILFTIEQTGETVQICRNGKPVANIIAARIPTRHKLPQPDRILRKVIVKGDITQPLSPEDWGNLY